MEQLKKNDSNALKCCGAISCYTLLTILAAASLLLLTGCAGQYRTCPDLSLVPPGEVLPIDGTWKNRHGVIFRIERGRLYTLNKIGDLPANSVLQRDFTRLSPGHYKCEGENFNRKKRLSDFSPISVAISSTNSITFNAMPNPTTGYKGGRFSFSVHKLDDEPSFLSELLATSDIPKTERIKAIGRVTDQALLRRLVFEENEVNVRKAAIKRIEDQSLLARLAMEDKESSIRLTAVERLTDQALLTNLALQAKDKAVRRAAVEGITDQTRLAGITIDSKDWNIKKLAFQKINDEKLISKIASEAPDEAVRTAASVRLGKTTWSDVLSKAIEDDAKIGPAISAIAWADKQEALSKQVTVLSHRYIRKGDVTRIPELKELLRLYGTKALAED